MERGYDPIALAEATRKIVERDGKRKYYRFRGGRWYGGIATADCVGCNLRCIFCWSNVPRDNPTMSWKFYSPEEVYRNLVKIAERRRYRLIRISGNEPTICWDHLIKILELVEQDGRFKFILETNGILIDKSKAEDLSKFRRVHVRVSLKGTCEEEFSLLTGARPEAFELQLNALKHLADHSVPAHPAAMLSFSSRENISKLIKRLDEIDPVYVREFEEEYVFLYPHVKDRLRRAGITPKVAYEPDRVPEDLV
ncbi:MAG: molybdenum cofactor biosynthesis protein MoaA [Thermoproteota archaeon]|uniref:Radical SAM protein n=1 Tax=Candidatus Methanodesulfokora washburnensis TaxID=2478471 RepID=A0A520KI20_9CREN|nr:MAG: radical SAM protein [Candidatus Methanodesulfokores washburnensis]TDA37503.1 MAG: molybdenum cofactor biosynthesis protein MoaA [Candidatus Korarchaeota archaeon]